MTPFELEIVLALPQAKEEHQTGTLCYRGSNTTLNVRWGTTAIFVGGREYDLKEGEFDTRAAKVWLADKYECLMPEDRTFHCPQCGRQHGINGSTVKPGFHAFFSRSVSALVNAGLLIKITRRNSDRENRIVRISANLKRILEDDDTLKTPKIKVSKPKAKPKAKRKVVAKAKPTPKPVAPKPVEPKPAATPEAKEDGIYVTARFPVGELVMFGIPTGTQWKNSCSIDDPRADSWTAKAVQDSKMVLRDGRAMVKEFRTKDEAIAHAEELRRLLGAEMPIFLDKGKYYATHPAR